MYNGIKDAILREMDALEEKYASGAQISDKDLADIDKMAHAIKCIATYEAMNDYDDRRRSGRYETREYRRY